jgi:pectin methylesterase-like acyl-CoA thioesterase
MKNIFFFRSLIPGIVALFFSNTVSAQYDLIVAQDGSGNHTTVQAAINAAPTNNTVPYKIFIKNGRYREKITIPSNKPFIQLIGESVAKVILTYDDYAGKQTSCGVTVGTQNSASFSVNANDFSAINITFGNSHPFGVPDNNGQQAVAVLVNADRAVFKNCRFLGNQDTLYLKGSGTPRNYFKNCYIDGNVDFIFGSAVALFDSCVVYAKTRTGTANSYITAPNTPNGQSYGFVFRDARLPMNTGTTSYYLSRPWPSPTVADTRQKTVFINSKLSSHISPAGWSIWDANTVTSNLYYGEYNSRYFNDGMVDVSSRVPWSYQLTLAEANTYTPANIFGAWDPCTVTAGICNSATTDIAVSNFRGVKGASNSQFDWNISWPVSGIQHTLYRSSDNVTFAPVYSITATNDTAVNFSYTDASVPVAGASYYYYVAASKAGYSTHITDTVRISNAPEITVNASESLSLCGFSQYIGTPSATQTYTVAATNLTSNLVITPPPNFEVSSNNSTWFTNASPLSVTPTAGTVNTTTIYIRLNASVAGSYSGNVVNASGGATSVNVPVTGIAANPPTINSAVIQQWPLIANNNDDPAVRSNYVTANTPSFNRLYLSNGTTLATIPAYSSTYGQAFGANSNGDGTWTTAVGGPGGTLSRVHYEQFTVTATGRAVRVDSILLNAAFYNTNSNTKLAIVYSKSGFTTNDSTDVTGGVDQTGSAVTGTFATPVSLANQTGGPTNFYRIALNSATGVTIADGQTLTIRLYFSCGSTGTPRYAMIKNVTIKGESINPLPLNLISFEGTYNGEAVRLLWKTVNETQAAFFEVEKSNDGKDFNTIGKVNALNGSVNNYSLADPAPYAGINYYRLKMTGNGGETSYSKIVIINTRLKEGISIYPNPVRNNLTLSHSKAGKNAVVEIYSADGRRMLRTAVQPSAIQTAIDVSGLVNGVYLVIYYDGINKTTAKFIKQ